MKYSLCVASHVMAWHEHYYLHCHYSQSSMSELSTVSVIIIIILIIGFFWSGVHVPVHATGKCKRGYWLVTNCKFNMVFPSTCPFSVAKIYFKNACLYKVRLKIMLLENPEKQPSWQPMLLHFQSIDVSLCNLHIVCSETFIFTFMLCGMYMWNGLYYMNIQFWEVFI